MRFWHLLIMEKWKTKYTAFTVYRMTSITNIIGIYWLHHKLGTYSAKSQQIYNTIDVMDTGDLVLRPRQNKWVSITVVNHKITQSRILIGMVLASIRGMRQSCYIIKNIEKHTAHIIVSWPNPKQWVIVHTFDLMMIIRQSIYILSIITKELGKLKTHSPTYC